MNSSSHPNCSSSLSVTNSKYWVIRSEFIPIKLTGKDSVINSRSIFKASSRIIRIRSFGTLFIRWCSCKCTAKSQCTPSSLEINSFEKVSPGIRPRFFNQNIEQNAPLKNIPSTAAKAIKRSAKLGESIHFIAQSAFFLIAGKFSNALNNLSFSSSSLT